MGFNQLGFSLHLRITSANLPSRARLSAEAQGFEPRVPCGTLVFKTSAFDHSANLPLVSSATNRNLTCVLRFKSSSR